MIHNEVDKALRPSARRRARIGAAALAALTAIGLLTVPRLVDPAGATVPAGTPVAAAEHMTAHTGGLAISGWAYDPDTTAPINVYVTIDGKRATIAGEPVHADDPRPDLAATHPRAVKHGYSTTVRVPAGTHTVCVWARNAAGTRGADRLQRCSARVFNYNPIGAVQSFKTAPGSLHVSGWAVDSDNITTALTVLVTIDGTTRRVTASNTNAASDDFFHAAGTHHGFTLTVPASQGRHTVCVTAVSIGVGANTSLRCGTLTLAESPVGTINTLARSGKSIRVRGWTYDPDAPTTPLSVVLTVDGKNRTITANKNRPDVAAAHPAAGPNHGFDVLLALSEGMHRICVTAHNLSFGSNTALDCRTVTLSFTPTAAITALTATATGAKVTGWASDPDTPHKPIRATVKVNGVTRSTVTANHSAASHSGHAYTVSLPTHSGKRTFCVIGLNVYFGTHNSKPACRSITLALSPLGHFRGLARAAGSTNIVASGWAFDPDTTASTTVAITVDGKTAGTYKTTVASAAVPAAYPSAGKAPHGFAQQLTADDGEHTVCVTAINYQGGRNSNLGCKVINAVHPVAPSAPRTVTALAGYGGATVSWVAPANDGGAPWSSYTVRSSDGHSTTVPATSTSATITGLKSKTTYTFTVTATNVAGVSPASTSPAVTTQASPPAQTTPAPVSTSRYIRNVSAATSADLATMTREGVADAKANPSGHGYLVLLDIGGQDQYDGGVVLSATTHYVSYANLVNDINAYVNGYHSAQKASAPVTIAIGTNNDIDVSAASGAAWATRVINPIRSHASSFAGIAIAGANDIEPGFRATYGQTKSWLAGYLGATSAPFIFNGSADGCAYTVTNRGCNNGWSMAGLYYLAAGAAPVRTLNLPQIYNNTMAAQWKYISLTGIGQGNPRINFGGPLTEYTACDQTNGCGSISGHSAWSQMWNNLQSDSRLKVKSLPYSTDLRIDR